MRKTTQQRLNSLTISERQLLTLAELSRGCALPAEQILSMVEYGIIEPLEPYRNCTQWQFSVSCVTRLQTATRLQRDLEINLAGAALALDLLDEVKDLRQKVAALRRE